MHAGETLVEVKTALACETLIEDGMEVAFLDYFTAPARHVYRIGQRLIMARRPSAWLIDTVAILGRNASGRAARAGDATADSRA
ncbi:hypothetical protein N234_35905 [Ralstonia pickettii DTP0602]|nr:hypothetical protein N234_35905 [Ralstonia pickettii DTP0602]